MSPKEQAAVDEAHAAIEMAVEILPALFQLVARNWDGHSDHDAAADLAQHQRELDWLLTHARDKLRFARPDGAIERELA